mmetsp:Transcript_7783/g.19082  ORF Transcript_7783/g.19082 Transcript_7783/m.19082 type:complete len:563 (-) Transcript_7783:81-1769(-)
MPEIRSAERRRWKVVSRTGVRIRSSHSVYSKTLGKLENKAVVEEISRNGDWLQHPDGWSLTGLGVKKLLVMLDGINGNALGPPQNDFSVRSNIASTAQSNPANGDRKLGNMQTESDVFEAAHQREHPKIKSEVGSEKLVISSDKAEQETGQSSVHQLAISESSDAEAVEAKINGIINIANICGNMHEGKASSMENSTLQAPATEHLKNREEDHSDEKIIRVPCCLTCGWVSKNPWLVRRHVFSRHTDEPLKCRCGESFTSKEKIRAHVSMHGGDREHGTTGVASLSELELKEKMEDQIDNEEKFHSEDSDESSGSESKSSCNENNNAADDVRPPSRRRPDQEAGRRGKRQRIVGKTELSEAELSEVEKASSSPLWQNLTRDEKRANTWNFNASGLTNKDENEVILVLKHSPGPVKRIGLQGTSHKRLQMDSARWLREAIKLPSCSSLEELDLSTNSLYDDGVMHIIAKLVMHRKETIRVLSLQRNSLSKNWIYKYLKYLVESAPNLRSLDLGFNSLCDNSPELNAFLEVAFRHKNLKSLLLNDNYLNKQTTEKVSKWMSRVL